MFHFERAVVHIDDTPDTDLYVCASLMTSLQSDLICFCFLASSNQSFSSSKNKVFETDFRNGGKFRLAATSFREFSYGKKHKVSHSVSLDGTFDDFKGSMILIIAKLTCAMQSFFAQKKVKS